MQRILRSALPLLALLGGMALGHPLEAQMHRSLRSAPQPFPFERAEPRPFPEFQAENSAAETAAELQREEHESTDHPGRAPVTASRPPRVRLYDPALRTATGGLELLPGRNAGTGKAQFSSTRMIPEAAKDAYPFSAVGKIFALLSDGSELSCSGALIGPRIVLTAGHCVHLGKGGDAGWVEALLFVPGYHQGEGIGIWEASAIWVTNTWYNGGGTAPNAADYAVVVLEDNERGRAGDVAGWLGFLTKKLSPNHVTMIGYPAAFDAGEWMHLTSSQNAKSGGNSTVLYGSDMTQGSSGGPWVQNFGQPAVGQRGGSNSAVNRIVGVMSYGPNQPKNSFLAGSSVLDQRFTSIYNEACADDPGNCR